MPSGSSAPLSHDLLASTPRACVVIPFCRAGGAAAPLHTRMGSACQRRGGAAAAAGASETVVTDLTNFRMGVMSHVKLTAHSLKTLVRSGRFVILREQAVRGQWDVE